MNDVGSKISFAIFEEIKNKADSLDIALEDRWCWLFI